MLAKLEGLLKHGLDFHQEDSRYATHNLHSFPAKFPPQLPRMFIEGLTYSGDVVLDPMSGSGTTIVEALLTGRQAIGCDIDPLAILLNQVKTSPLDVTIVEEEYRRLIKRAELMVQQGTSSLKTRLARHTDVATRRFLGYWFSPEVQLSLLPILASIRHIQEPALRRFFLLSFSATIINRTGGVSLAIDLAHTRPHRAKLALNEAGQIVHGSEAALNPRRPRRYQVKVLRPVFAEFERQVRRNIQAMMGVPTDQPEPWLATANAQSLPLADNAIDLIVTSPPYAANAIDYMRAHKFTLAWLGYSISTLAAYRRRYIGSADAGQTAMESLPSLPAAIVGQVSASDLKAGKALSRYYAEMMATMREMVRVLKPGRAAILVVGNSTLRGVDTHTAMCLVEIGKAIGFHVPGMTVRRLDRDRRMMPASSNGSDTESRIQQRMHEEWVIGFYKPLR